MTNKQKEALKTIFSGYENYVVMSCEGNDLMYLKDLIPAVIELAKAFPDIALKNDKLGIFRNYMRKKRNV